MEDNFSYKVTKPRRKRRRYTKLEFPFPIPLQRTPTSNVWYYYEGCLRCNSVAVENVGDLTFLYKMLVQCQQTASVDAPVSQSESLVTCEDKIHDDQDCDDKDDDGVDDDDENIDDDDDDVIIADVIMELVNKGPRLGQDAVSDSSGRKKEDPYQIYEFLQLTFEEAFFLSFGLGSLSILLDNQKLSLSVLWSEFCQRNPDFFRNYIAYHYYRSKGWVPQVGLKYGSDLVLYKKGMPFFHSSFAVVTSLVDEEGKRSQLPGNTSSGQKWTWKSLASMNRLNEHVAKELLLCSITIPSEKQDGVFRNPQNLRDLTVQETIVRRWIPKKAREPSNEN